MSDGARIGPGERVRGVRRVGVAAATLVIAALALVLGGGAAAGALPSSGIEHVESWSTNVAVQPDGSVVVHEVIRWDFGYVPKHGIIRDIPTRFRYDDVKKNWDRVTPLEVISVSSPDAPAQYTTKTNGDITQIKIGDPNRTTAGAHTYDLRYRLRGVLNHFADHDELYLNVIGAEQTVSVTNARAQVQVPGVVKKAACFAGPAGSQLPCDRHAIDGRTAVFVATNLPAHNAFTVVVGFPTGLVPTPLPILKERWSIQKAFAARPDTLGLSGGLLAGVLAGFGMIVWKVGRDRRFAGSATDVAFGGTGVGEESVPLMGRDPATVQFEPPDGLRPGQVGTLIDEQANPLDVTATIVDLAVRGFLRIEEIPKEGWFGKPDWRLVKLEQDENVLQPYERKLYDSLFGGQSEKLLSELKDHFATKLEAVEDMLYADVVRQGWFSRRPDAVRTMWTGIGVGVLVAGVALTVALAKFTTYGLVGLPVMVAGLLLLIGAKRMPRRTAKGYGVLQRVLGFKQFIDESEKDRAQFAERQHLFTEYLPYAIVFGATEKWARAFEGLDGVLPQQGWYVGQDAFTVVAFSLAIDGFTVTSAGTISSVPAASSGSSGFGGGGFSGGGFGGGGGSSW